MLSARDIVEHPGESRRRVSVCARAGCASRIPGAARFEDGPATCTPTWSTRQGDARHVPRPSGSKPARCSLDFAHARDDPEILARDLHNSSRSRSCAGIRNRLRALSWGKRARMFPQASSIVGAANTAQSRAGLGVPLLATKTDLDQSFVDAPEGLPRAKLSDFMWRELPRSMERSTPEGFPRLPRIGPARRGVSRVRPQAPTRRAPGRLIQLRSIQRRLSL